MRFSFEIPLFPESSLREQTSGFAFATFPGSGTEEVPRPGKAAQKPDIECRNTHMQMSKDGSATVRGAIKDMGASRAVVLLEGAIYAGI